MLVLRHMWLGVVVAMHVDVNVFLCYDDFLLLDMLVLRLFVWILCYSCGVCFDLGEAFLLL